MFRNNVLNIYPPIYLGRWVDRVQLLSCLPTHQLSICKKRGRRIWREESRVTIGASGRRCLSPNGESVKFVKPAGASFDEQAGKRIFNKQPTGQEYLVHSTFGWETKSQCCYHCRVATARLIRNRQGVLNAWRVHGGGLDAA